MSSIERLRDRALALAAARDFADRLFRREMASDVVRFQVCSELAARFLRRDRFAWLPFTRPTMRSAP